MQLLPEDVPPYPTGADLPSTPYRLVELIGTGGFGAVYRAYSPTLQHLPLAIKFCLDRGLVPALNQERSNLERLMRAGGPGAAHVVRLYGYDLDHPTPFLVYEFVAGGDLTAQLAARRVALGRPPGSDEVLGWVTQITDGLAAAAASWWATARLRRHLRDKFDRGVGQFAADYPRLVAGWGGRGTLEGGETIAALLKTYDPEAAVRRPGFLRRLFGG